MSASVTVLFDDPCPECGHRVGNHYAVRNALDMYGASCELAECECQADFETLNA